MTDLEQMPIAGRERVCCYITRGHELLVFEHDQEYDDGAVGTQVVGGGVDEGETLEQAALRETFEESGLVLERAVYLGTSHYESKFGRLEGQKQVRHYFWLEAPPQTPDSWSHTVSSGELDKGMVFHHRFVALEDVDLVFEMGEMLEKLEEAKIWKASAAAREETLETFGRIIVQKIRDVSIKQTDDTLKGLYKGIYARELQRVVTDESLDKNTLLEMLVPYFTDEIITIFLQVLWDELEIKVSVRTKAQDFRLIELSDGLDAEYLGKDGWIDRYSNQRKDVMKENAEANFHKNWSKPNE